MMHDHTSCHCDVCKVPHFERNNYFHGKMLSARDLAAEQGYFNEKRWLINRMVLGWGIVCGLDVCVEDGCLVLKPGLALDCCGRELLVCEPRRLHGNTIAEEIGIDTRGTTEYTKPLKPAEYTKPTERPTPNQNAEYTEYTNESQSVPWALCLEYRECRTEPVKTPRSCERNERGGDYNRIRDGYRLSIRHREDVCPEDHSDDCCPYEGLGHETPLHRALVAGSRKCPRCKDCECVLLATGTLTTKPGQPPQIDLDDDYWKYTPIVYTNPALAGVIRCFHGGLAHIDGINWKPSAHYDVDDFFDRLGREHLKVTFDQPMNEYSVENVRSCRLSIFLSHDGSCPLQFLIPVERIEYNDCTATYYFDDDCVERELRRTCKKLKKAAEVELVLHGSMIHNKKGRALDAELIHDFPTGNGIEGGDFITYFTVGP